MSKSITEVLQGRTYRIGSAVSQVELDHIGIDYIRTANHRQAGNAFSHFLSKIIKVNESVTRDGLFFHSDCVVFTTEEFKAFMLGILGKNWETAPHQFPDELDVSDKTKEMLND